MPEEDFATYISALRDLMFGQNIYFEWMPACYNLSPTLFLEYLIDCNFFLVTSDVKGEGDGYDYIILFVISDQF